MSLESIFDVQTGHLTIYGRPTEIPSDRFSSSTYKIKSVYIPPSVLSIGARAFAGNILSQISIPDSVETIGSEAFRGNKISRVTIPDSVTSIGSAAFAGNELTELDIPNSVKTINTYAFTGNHISKVVIPDSVTSIGYDAFTKNKITEVRLPAHFESNPPYGAFDAGVNLIFESGIEINPDLPGPLDSLDGDNIINSVRGKGRLLGGPGSDEFAFDIYDKFDKRGADKILDFNSSEGDYISFTEFSIPKLAGRYSISFASASDKKQLRRLSKQDYDFIYFKKKGRLYFDGNGSEKYWGDASEGGLVAILNGKPELSAGDIALLT